MAEGYGINENGGLYLAPGNPFALPSTTIGGAPGQLGLQGGPGAEWASLGRDELNALIQYRNAQLAAQQAQAGQQDALARAQMGQQGSQFDKQLFLNEQMARAADLAKFRDYELSAELGRGGMNLQETLGRIGAQGGALSAAAQEGLARQQLGIQGFSAAEQARVAQQQQALQTAQLVASLRGPSNAFKQLEVNMGLNRTGQSNLLGALAGEWGVPQYQAPGGVPEAATLQTMARDSGSTGSLGGGGGFSSSAGIQGLLGIGAQNAWIGADPATYNAQIQLAEDQKRRLEEMRPGQASMGAQLAEAWAAVLKSRNGVPPPPDDPAVLQYWMQISTLSEPQARAMALFAHDFAKTRGTAMSEDQLNDMIGQVKMGRNINPAEWRRPGLPVIIRTGGPSDLPPGSPGAPPVAQPTPPGQTPPGWSPPPTPTPGAPTPGTPPPGPSLGARILQRSQELMAAGQLNDATVRAMWQELAGATPAQAEILNQIAKNYYVQHRTPIGEGQLNDLWGQVSSGQAPDPTKWRQPPPAPRQGQALPPAEMEGLIRRADELGLISGQGEADMIRQNAGAFTDLAGWDDFAARLQRGVHRGTQSATPTVGAALPPTAQPLVAPASPELESMIRRADELGLISGQGEAAAIRQNAGAFANLAGWDDFAGRLRSGVHRTQTPQATVGPAIPQSAYAAPTAAPAPPSPSTPPKVSYTFTGQGFKGTDGSEYDAQWNKVGGGGRQTFGSGVEAAAAAGGEKTGWDYTNTADGRVIYSPRV